MMQHQYYSKRWLDALDAMLEKGKRNLITKLRVIKVIEADFQLLMRMYLGIRVNEFAEIIIDKIPSNKSRTNLFR